MTAEQDQVEVIIRVMDGETLALFPYIPHHDRYVTCYAHVGQHGTADYNHCICKSRPATPEEAEPLLKELRQIGYTPRVIRRANFRKRHHA